jgi:hypothetical protein
MARRFVPHHRRSLSSPVPPHPRWLHALSVLESTESVNFTRWRVEGGSAGYFLSIQLSVILYESSKPHPNI